MPRVIENDVKNRMRPALELVLLSARAKSFENDNRIKALFDAGVNWSEMLACAIQHKLVPVLYERVRDLNARWLSQDQRVTLTELARNTARSNLAFMNEMLGLYGRFEAAQIPAIPFKGPALAWLAYPNFAHRSCADLDFVVPQRYIPESVSVLQAQGYIPQFSPIEAQAGQDGPAPGQYAFSPTGHRSFVEVHTERTLRYFSRPIDLQELNSRVLTLEIGGKNVRTFSVEDLLVMLCVHGAKHFWERLAWIVDIAQLITACEVDWPLLLEIAAKRQSTRVLLLGLYLAHEVIGASLPQSVLDRALDDSHVKYLSSKIVEQYNGNSDSSVGVWPRAAFRLRSCDGYWQGLRQLSRLSMSPTESDRQTISLPGFLSPLYTLVRPFRLLGQYGLGLNRQGKPDLAIYQPPTPQEIVEQMLQLANLSPGDVLYDLGCGDGRIVVTASEKYGVRAVGVDINPTRIAEARANARRHGVEKRVQFILGDAKKADFAEATVIAIYLGTDGNLRLADRLRAHPRAGTRIVSRDFQIYGWEPERIENRTMANGVETSLYLWTIKNSNWKSPGTTHASPGAAAAG
jgi:2-polyprenyl-3-methyl-5-hydroxy-6-metoxy-1,4-benzoquinol methylase